MMMLGSPGLPGYLESGTCAPGQSAVDKVARYQAFLGAKAQALLDAALFHFLCQLQQDNVDPPFRRKS